MIRMAISLIGLVFFSAIVSATTWNEPWNEEVVQQADTFVLAKVLRVESETKARLTLTKHLAGAVVAKEFVIEGFYLLTVMSRSAGHPPELRLRQGQTYYLLLKKNKAASTWALATPTAGSAPVRAEGVQATYRHSYHQGYVPASLYEPTMTAIFQHLHGQAVDRAALRTLFDAQLNVPPQSIPDDPQEKEQMARFFAQHVALECFYYFGTEARAALLEPFLQSDDAHVQISAARALSAVNTAAARQRLLDFVQGKGEGFAKVMAIWGLRRQQAKELLPQLMALEPKLADEATGFGGSIMDPRVATHFPSSVRAALKELIDEWQAKK